jgi:hypothetical protein
VAQPHSALLRAASACDGGRRLRRDYARTHGPLDFRRRTDIHKRLVIIATRELVTAAVARWPVISALGPVAFFGVTDLFLVALAVYVSWLIT